MRILEKSERFYHVYSNINVSTKPRKGTRTKRSERPNFYMLILNKTKELLYKTVAFLVFFYSTDKHEMQMCVDAYGFMMSSNNQN